MIQLVAYSQETKWFDTTPTELDIDTEEQISISYQASEIKDFSSKQGSFSQSFQLPFTDTNNNFFEHNYNVNKSEGDFDIYSKTFCSLIVDGLEVLNGYLYINAINLTSQGYEVTVVGELATLKEDIKELTLNDLDDSYWFPFRHDLTYDNVVDSWDFAISYGGTPPITSGIVYPFINYGINGKVWQYGGNTSNSINKNTGAITLDEFKPAVQVKLLFDRIFEEAGYEYESNFISNNDFDFDLIYMNLASEFEKVKFRPASLYFEADTSSEQALTTGSSPTPDDVEFDNEIRDDANTFNPFTYTWVADKVGTYAFLLDLTIEVDMTGSGTTASPSTFMYFNTSFGTPNQIFLDYTKDGTVDSQLNYADYDSNVTTSIQVRLLQDGVMYWSKAVSFDLKDNLPTIGEGNPFVAPAPTLSDGSVKTVNIKEIIYINVTDATVGWKFDIDSSFTFGGIPLYIDYGIPNASIKVNSLWQQRLQPNTPQEETIFIEDNLPKISQIDFLKAIFEQFNMFVEPFRDNPKKLKIEPYPDYIDEGEIVDWTDKLDESKEVQIIPTTDYRNQEINFEWLPDDCYADKYAREVRTKPYGGYKFEDQSDLTQGEFTNFTVFGSPTNRLIKTASNTAIREYCVMDLSARDNDGSAVALKGKPRIFYFKKKTVGTLASDFYKIVDPSTGDEIEVNSYGYAGHYSDVPATSGVFNLNWNETYSGIYNKTIWIDTPSQNNVFDAYWQRYINEIYSPDARILSAYFYLTPVDIHNLRFNHKVFVKDCFYRINKIDGYSPNSDSPTKVELIKLFDSKEGLGNKCTLTVKNFVKDGTVTFQDGQGNTETPTKECCEAYGFTWIAGEGTSDCYWRIYSEGDAPFEPDNSQFT